jgi:hypothetical protein
MTYALTKLKVRTNVYYVLLILINFLKVDAGLDSKIWALPLPHAMD